jgi:hypothetical protein
MNSTASSKEVYSVANVPWAMYFHEAYALHGAYWHNGFGRARSHGCVNLAPKDARWLYEFIGPEMPPGWSALEADASAPGSAVRIRSRRDPQPRFRSLAAKVEPERAGLASN